MPSLASQNVQDGWEVVAIGALYAGAQLCDR